MAIPKFSHEGKASISKMMFCCRTRIRLMAVRFSELVESVGHCEATCKVTELFGWRMNESSNAGIVYYLRSRRPGATKR